MQNLVGKPFGKNGRGPDIYDCFGLLLAAYEYAQIDLPDPFVPAFDEERYQAFRARFVEIEEPSEFLDILYRTRPRAHVSVVISGGYALEANEGSLSKLVRLDLLSPMKSFRLR